MYIAGQPYKCIKCGFEFKYSPDDPHHAPVLAREESTDRGIVTYHMPVCPNCWAEFLSKNVGLGYCTIAWDKNGSDYDNHKK